MSISEIIKFIISYINNNYTIRSDKKLKLTFDELKPDKDSIMFSLADDNTVVEKKDITGMFADGEISIQCYYRIMANDNGFADLDSIKIVDDLVSFIKSNYKSIKTDEFYVSGVVVKASAKLAAAYSNGAKDFISKFSINYGRRL